MKKIKNLLDSNIKILFSTLRNLRKIESSLSHVEFSPIERHILQSYALKNKGLFHYSYDLWRVNRINKILEIYDIDSLKKKRILELGGGHGDIGAFFASAGAEVITLEGRLQNVNIAKLKHRNVDNYKCFLFNLETDFSEFGKFDLIINFGLLYHLKNAKAHIEFCLKNSNDILFETVVCDSKDPDAIFFCKGDSANNEESLEGTGCRPSPFYIEKIVKENGFEIIRIFDSNLNSGDQFIYDWAHGKTNKIDKGYSLRRFWRFKKSTGL